MSQSGKWILRLVLAAGLLAVMADTASAQLLRRNRGSNGGYYGAPQYGGSGLYNAPPYYGLPGDYGSNNLTAGPNNGYQANYFAPFNDSATIDVRVPTDAKVWFDDQPTRQTGELRSFYTPRLSGDTVYYYTVKATWDDNGKPVERTRKIAIRPGSRQVVDFINPQSTGDNPSELKPKTTDK